MLALGIYALLRDVEEMVWVPTLPGLTVIYGKNGAGKSRVLRACAEASAVRDRVPSTWELLYRTGFVQVRQPLTPERLASDTDRTALMLAYHLVESRAPTDPFDDRVLAPPDAVDAAELHRSLVALVTERLHEHGGAAEATSLLERGHLIVVPVLVEHHFGPRTETAVFLGTTRADHIIESAFVARAIDGSVNDLNILESQRAVDRDGDTQYPLPPSPAGYFDQELHDWTALPVAYLGTVPWPIVSAWTSDVGVEQSEHSATELAAASWEEATRRASLRRPDSASAEDLVISFADGGAQLHIAGPVVDEINQIAAHVNNLLRLLVEEPPGIVPRPGTSVTAPIVWGATWDRNTFFDLEQLGDAHRRFAKLAIQRALSPRFGTTDVDLATAPIELLLIDEPERATHPAAAARLAQALPELAECVLAASHSIEIMDATDQLLRVHRERRSVRVEDLRIDFGDQRKELAEALGISVAGLATLARVIVLVEGAHDLDVITRFCRDDLQAARADVVPLGGTYGLAHLADAKWLVRSTDVPLLVVLDNVPDAQHIEAMLSSIRSAPSQPMQHRIRAEQQKHDRWTTPERKMLDSLLDAAITAGCVDRLHVFGFTERDIARYLPAEELLPGARSWDEVEQGFLDSVGRGWRTGDGKRFKDWVTSHGGSYTAIGVRQAAERLVKQWDAGGGRSHERPDEFSALGRIIRALAQS